ncbi:MAG: hypothetical protein WCG30_04025 [Candidatus Saccharibacteria bacterium]
MTNKPEIRINYAYLLTGVSEILDRHYNPGKSKLASFEQCEEWTEDYRKEWEKYQSKILSALHDILGLKFYRDVIDVSLAQYFIPQSEPLIIHFRNEPDLFVDVLSHELIHILLTDNDVFQLNNHDRRVDLIKIWKEMFGNNFDFGTLVHIPVHAVLKSLYIDYLHDESRYLRDIEKAKELKNTKNYADAWEYVEKNDYKQIIEELKTSYSHLKTSFI